MIEKEIDSDWSITNLHGCDLKQSLIRPKKRKLWCGNVLKEYWIVLEENRETMQGHKVYFDEESQKFGVAVHGEPFGYTVNSFDSFLKAFKAM